MQRILPVIAAALLLSSGCGLARHAIPGPPTRVVIPPTATTPQTIVNIYDDRVETDGPACLREFHGPAGHGYELQPIPAPDVTNAPIWSQPPTTPPTREKPHTTPQPSLLASAVRWLWDNSRLVFVVVLAFWSVVATVYAIRRPLAAAAQSLDLSDGVTQEAAAFADAVGDQIAGDKQLAKDTVAKFRGRKPAKAPPKKSPAKKSR